jgi:hypothetical protein
MCNLYAPTNLRRNLLLTVVAVLALTGAAKAESPTNSDPSPSPASGIWRWTINNGNTEMRLRLTQEGDKLTGVLIAEGQPETTIERGKCEGNKISFRVSKMMGKLKVVAVYGGVVNGDTITGGMKPYFGTRPNKSRPIPWQAQRAEQ